MCAQLGIRDKPRHPLARGACNQRGNSQYLEWPGGLVYLREQIKEIYQQSVFEKRSFQWGETGAWLLEIGREIPWNKGSTAGCEASRELDCQQFKGGEQQEGRAQLLAGVERLGRKAFPHKRKRKRRGLKEEHPGHKSQLAWWFHAINTLEAACHAASGHFVWHSAFSFQPDAAEKQILATEQQGAVLYTAK